MSFISKRKAQQFTWCIILATALYIPTQIAFAKEFLNQNTDYLKNNDKVLNDGSLTVPTLPGQTTTTSETNHEMASEDEGHAALRAADKAEIKGPAKIPLIDQAILALPADYIFIPQKESAKLLELTGNRLDPDLVGIVTQQKDLQGWIIIITFIKSGYISDSDAKSWNADDLLKSITEGTKQSNVDRMAKGIPTLEVLGWAERPTYDDKKNQLIYSILAKDSLATSQNSINYKTYALGRDGYFDLTLVTDEATIATDKENAKKILSSLEFNNKKHYADFNKSTDHMAEYGLAALVTGVVVKKLGLLALAGFWFIKLWKVLIILPLLIWAKLKKLVKK
jgi:uncharacterized membrane-anchored protein